ncbi:MAG: XrtA/PEP-CTERM system-associated ATPase [Gammaproteobacteria bacterium]
MYREYYNFTGKPFQITPDHRFFYESNGHKRALSYLLYGIKAMEGFIVITGDVGTGKTTLVNALSDELENKHIVAAKVVTTQVQEDDLLRVVAAEFGLSYDGVSKAVLLKNLETFFRQLAHEGKRALLLVDEAQNLPPRSIEELRMLSNFQMDSRALLQSFLLGQREFRATMRLPQFEQLRQRVIAAYHLKPMTRDETEGYIIHRLKMVGWVGNPLFTDEAFDAIYDHAKGIPRKINVFCDRLLLCAALEESNEIGNEIIEMVSGDLVEESWGTDDLDPAAGPGQVNPIKSEVPNVDSAANGLLQQEQLISAIGNMMDSKLEEFKKKQKQIENNDLTAKLASIEKKGAAVIQKNSESSRVVQGFIPPTESKPGESS